MINALSNQVIFLGEFNSKRKQFGCVKPNKSGQTLVNITKDLKLFYINQLGSNRQTRDDSFHGTLDILDKAFISPALSSRDISFSVADDHMGSDHSPSKFHLASHSSEIHHLLNHVTDLTKQTMTCYTTH